MILRRLTANFGVLSHRSLTLEPGLNVIEAPNEAGKSTWCAFLRVMLYGPGPARGGKNGTRSDRELYAPWDGSPMEGMIDLAWEGKDVTIRRTAGPAGPMRSFTAVYTGTNRAVSGLTESDAGERLTGLDAEVFSRTAFIGPAGLRVTPGPELEKYIASAVASGEEGVSYSEAAARLNAWQRRFRYRDRGRLPEQEAELRAVESDLEALSGLDAELEETESREQRTAASYSERADRLEAAARETAQDRREEVRLREEASRRAREAESLRSALESSPLADSAPDRAFLEKARADSRRAAAILKAEKKSAGLPLWALCLGLALLGAAGGFFRPLFFLLCGGALAAAAILYYLGRPDRMRRQRRQKELSALKKRYGTAAPKGILAAAGEHARRARELRSLEGAARELTGRAEELSRRGAEGPGSASLIAAGEELRSLSAQKARLLAQRDALGDRRTLIDRRDALRAALDRDRRTSDALYVALAELTSADEERQARFAPELSRRTGEYFRALTGGRYETLALDRELTAAVTGAGEALPRPDRSLSRGTREQLYLALRLALCEENDCPLILDDALAFFDDERLALALDLLRELSQTRQILLFTCQSREKRLLE